jgi:hypothetical protein
MIFSKPYLIKIIAFIILGAGPVGCLLFAKTARAENHAVPTQCRYSLPDGFLDKPFQFAGEVIPVRRPDVRYRLICQINFLLLDARSVLTEWLSEKSRHSWLFDEVFAKEGIPKDFALLGPILSALNAKVLSRSPGYGWWYLSRSCAPGEGGPVMSEDSWHDDRLDLELSTRCFATRIKEIRKETGDTGWLMPVMAYMTSVKTIQELRERWNTGVFWDLPLPEAAEEVVLRWIALSIVNSNRETYGLRFKDAPPLVFDQIGGLVLAKDLTVAEIARITRVPPREILRLNPRIKPQPAVFPAKSGGKTQTHTVAAPRGTGNVLLETLKKEGYLAPPAKP